MKKRMQKWVTVFLWPVVNENELEKITAQARDKIAKI